MPEARRYLWVVHAQSGDEPSRVTYQPTQTLQHLKNEARNIFPKLANVPNDKICFLEGATVLRNNDLCEKFRVGNSTNFPLVLTFNVDENYVPFKWLNNILVEDRNGIAATLCCCNIYETANEDEESLVTDNAIRKEMQPMNTVINADVVASKDIL